jgi:HK97 family phage major capsid protein
MAGDPRSVFCGRFQAQREEKAMSHDFKTPDEALKTLADTTDGLKAVQKRVDDELATKAELQEFKEKVLPDLEAACKFIQETNKKPIQDDAEFRWKTPTAPLKAARHPDGGEEHPYEYLMRQRAEKGSDLQQFQKLNDQIVMLGKLLGVKRRDRLFETAEYAAWKRHHDFLIKDNTAYASTVSDKGDEWVPAEIMSSDLIDLARDKTMLANLFQQVTMTGPSFKRPRIDSDAAAVVISEEVHAPHEASWPTATPYAVANTGQTTWTAVMLGFHSAVSNTQIEDTPHDVMSWLPGYMARKIADGIDEAILNGDTASPHQDSGTVTSTSTDRRTAWLGLRAHALDQSYTTDGGGNPIIADDIATSKGAMTKYGGFQNSTYGPTVIITSYSVYADLAKDADITTVDKYGPAAAIISGEVARVHGLPVVPSEFFFTDLNSTGVADGTTTSLLSGAILASTGAWGVGQRRSMKITSSTDIGLITDQIVVAGFWRGDFQPMVDVTGQRIVDYIIQV